MTQKIIKEKKSKARVLNKSDTSLNIIMTIEQFIAFFLDETDNLKKNPFYQKFKKILENFPLYTIDNCFFKQRNFTC